MLEPLFNYVHPFYFFVKIRIILIDLPVDIFISMIIFDSILIDYYDNLLIYRLVNYQIMLISLLKEAQHS